MRRPAVHEARVSCEPQRHHEDEKCQNAELSVAHGSQTGMLVPDDLVCCPLLLRLDRTATPRLPQAVVHKSKKTQSCL